MVVMKGGSSISMECKWSPWGCLGYETYGELHRGRQYCFTPRLVVGVWIPSIKGSLRAGNPMSGLDVANERFPCAILDKQVGNDGKPDVDSSSHGGVQQRGCELELSPFEPFAMVLCNSRRSPDSKRLNIVLLVTNMMLYGLNSFLSATMHCDMARLDARRDVVPSFDPLVLYWYDIEKKMELLQAEERK